MVGQLAEVFSVDADLEEVGGLVVEPVLMSQSAGETRDRFVALGLRVAENDARGVPPQVHAVNVAGSQGAVQECPHPRLATRTHKWVPAGCPEPGQRDHAQIPAGPRDPGHVIQADVGIGFLRESLAEDDLPKAQLRVAEGQPPNGPAGLEIEFLLPLRRGIGGQGLEFGFDCRQGLFVRPRLYAGRLQVGRQEPRPVEKLGRGEPRRDRCRRGLPEPVGLDHLAIGFSENLPGGH